MAPNAQAGLEQRLASGCYSYMDFEMFLKHLGFQDKPSQRKLREFKKREIEEIMMIEIEFPKFSENIIEDVVEIIKARSIKSPWMKIAN